MSLFSPAQPQRLLHQPALSLARQPLRQGRPVPRGVFPQFRPSTDENRASQGNPHGRASTVMIAGRLSAPSTLSGPAMSITVSANCKDFGSDTSGVNKQGLDFIDVAQGHLMAANLPL